MPKPRQHWNTQKSMLLLVFFALSGNCGPDCCKQPHIILTELLENYRAPLDSSADLEDQFMDTA